MLINDLLNTLFDQSDYPTIIILSSLHKRKSSYARKYALLSYYENKGGWLLHSDSLKILKLFGDGTSGERSLLLNAMKGNIEAVKYSVSIGIDVHTQRSNSFYWFSGDSCVAKYLDCALYHSVSNGNLQTVKYLISIGANMNILDEFALGHTWNTHVSDYLNKIGFIMQIMIDVD